MFHQSHRSTALSSGDIVDSTDGCDQDTLCSTRANFKGHSSQGLSTFCIIKSRVILDPVEYVRAVISSVSIFFCPAFFVIASA